MGPNSGLDEIEAGYAQQFAEEEEREQPQFNDEEEEDEDGGAPAEADEEEDEFARAEREYLSAMKDGIQLSAEDGLNI